MASSFNRNRFTWLAYLLLAFYGYFLNVLGPITPFLKDELHLNYTLSSLHFTAFAVGMLLVGLGGNRVEARLGSWRSLWLGAVGMSLAVGLLLIGTSPWVTIPASFLMGLVGSLILAIVPSSLYHQYGPQTSIALSEANVVASLVASVAPLMVGWFAAGLGGWRTGLALVACTPLLMYFAFRTLGREILGSPQPNHSPGLAVSGSSGRLPSLFWVYWLSLVLAVSVEFCMIFWSADYLETNLGLPKVQAAQAVSLFLVGMIFGRLAGSRLVQRFAVHAVVSLSTALAGAGFFTFWLAPTPLLSEAGLFIAGLGVASLYPLILSLAIGVAGPLTVQASARGTLASGSAILLLPLILGRLADQFGIHAAYSLVILLLVGVFSIVLYTSRVKLAALTA